MLIYKMAGVCLLISCGFLYPRLCARDRRVALVQIDKLISLIRFLRHEIELHRLSVRDILGRCDEALLSAFGGKQETLTALFDRTRWLDAEAEAVAKELAKELGRGGVSEQLLLCDRALSLLSACRTQREQGELGRRKTEGALSLGAAVLAVILLL